MHHVICSLLSIKFFRHVAVLLKHKTNTTHLLQNVHKKLHSVGGVTSVRKVRRDGKALESFDSQYERNSTTTRGF